MKIQRYQSFITEKNMDQARAIMMKKQDAFEKLKKLLHNNLGYIGKFTQFLMEENIPYGELETLFKELSDLKSKNASFDIQNLKYEQVLDKIQDAKEDLGIKWLINQFPSEQKKFARELLAYNRGDNHGYFYKVSQKENVKNFISKISRYKSPQELIAAAKVFSKNIQNERENVLESLKGMESKIVYDDKNFLIVKIESYKDIKVLGADTSWCIVAGESTFNSYTRNRYQFILYNYDKDEYDPYFKIGFTLNKDFSIHACHNILDHAFSGLSSLFRDKGISFADLIPKRAPLNITIDQILPRTNNDIITQFSEDCEEKDIIPMLNKILSFKAKSLSFRCGIVNTLCNRLFKDQPYIKESELAKINKDLVGDNSLITAKPLKSKILYSNFDTAAFHKDRTNWEKISLQIDMWGDKQIAFIGEDQFDDIVFGDHGYSRKLEIRSDINWEIVKKISDRMNHAYGVVKNVKEYYPTMGNENYPGVKLGKPFETAMLLFNIVLKRREQTPDYQAICQDGIYDGDRIKYFEYLQLPIDLTDNSLWGSRYTDKIIPYIIKKDYPNGVASIDTDIHSLAFCDKLAEYLKGHKVQFKISSKTVKWYHGHQDDSILRKIINKFKKTTVRSGQIQAEGDVSIRVI